MSLWHFWSKHVHFTFLISWWCFCTPDFIMCAAFKFLNLDVLLASEGSKSDRKIHRMYQNLTKHRFCSQYLCAELCAPFLHSHPWINLFFPTKKSHYWQDIYRNHTRCKEIVLDAWSNPAIPPNNETMYCNMGDHHEFWHCQDCTLQNQNPQRNLHVLDISWNLHVHQVSSVIQTSRPSLVQFDRNATKLQHNAERQPCGKRCTAQIFGAGRSNPISTEITSVPLFPSCLNLTYSSRMKTNTTHLSPFKVVLISPSKGYPQACEEVMSDALRIER